MSALTEVLTQLLRPNSIAVIGAAREPTKIGHVVLKNILECSFPKEKVFPVNPNAEEILGLKCYKSIKDVPNNVELAVITVPAKIVPQVLRESVEKGVKAIAIISAGFKEVGNVKEELELVEIARKGNARILGPNIIGVADTVKKVNASFMQQLPKEGRIAFVSQSGALAIGLAGWTSLKQIGLSDLVSIGNKADLNETDFIEYFGDDKHTKVITLYLEGVDDGRRFLEVSKKVSKKKPIIALKPGKSDRTTQAIKSHTGSLAGSDIAYEVAFKQAGIIRAPTIIELFDWAVAFDLLPLPRGENSVILTNGGGAGVMATDAAEEFKVKLMDIPKDLAEKLRNFMPPFGSVYNPVDLTGMASPSDYEGALKTLLEDDNVHNVIVLYCHTAQTNPIDLANALIRAKRSVNKEKPITACLIGGKECEEAIRLLISNGIPAYDTPEKAVAALGQLLKYRRFLERQKKEEGLQDIKVDKDKAEKVIRAVIEEKRNILLPSEAAEVAKSYGIPVVEKIRVTSAEEAVRAANSVGYPVVLEVESPNILHKVDVGGIILNIKSQDEVRQAYEKIMKSVREKAPNAEIRGIIVRKMAPQGREVAVGMHRDPIFGPLIMFGSGGTLIELYKDVSFRVAPLTKEDAEEMINETKASKLIEGIRGEKPSDKEKVKEIIIRLAKLAEDFPEIEDIDINPLFVYGVGDYETPALAADVKIVLRR
ncbi:MAG: acetate--CoA ligase family protein [Thaumarchaeota archaeon]|jgi:acetyl coenzyme A synthetase (ADP forming)-like protein|nr:acetate--CoA ligase family protein [Candidatus Terraquivivens yellowstonensis]MCL7398312.1 acetate--CoA ligase family protein [Candidatus Terraquivivens yellowstonensis]